jgi:hypothetical protein
MIRADEGCRLTDRAQRLEVPGGPPIDCVGWASDETREERSLGISRQGLVPPSPKQDSHGARCLHHDPCAARDEDEGIYADADAPSISEGTREHKGRKIG